MAPGMGGKTGEESSRQSVDARRKDDPLGLRGSAACGSVGSSDQGLSTLAGSDPVCLSRFGSCGAGPQGRHTSDAKQRPQLSGPAEALPKPDALGSGGPQANVHAHASGWCFGRSLPGSPGLPQRVPGPRDHLGRTLLHSPSMTTHTIQRGLRGLR